MQTVDAFLNRDGYRDLDGEADFANEGKRETDFLRPEHGPGVHIAEMHDHRIAYITLDDRAWDRTHRAGVGRVRFVQVPRVYLAIIGNGPGIALVLFLRRLVSSYDQGIHHLTTFSQGLVHCDWVRCPGRRMQRQIHRIRSGSGADSFNVFDRLAGDAINAAGL